MSVILNRREAATVIAGLRLLAGDGVRVPHHPYTVVAGLCDETDPEYELRFDAGEGCVRELIDRVLFGAPVAQLHSARRHLVEKRQGAVRGVRFHDWQMPIPWTAKRDVGYQYRTEMVKHSLAFRIDMIGTCPGRGPNAGRPANCGSHVLHRLLVGAICGKSHV